MTARMREARPARLGASTMPCSASRNTPLPPAASSISIGAYVADEPCKGLSTLTLLSPLLVFDPLLWFSPLPSRLWFKPLLRWSSSSRRVQAGKAGMREHKGGLQGCD